MKRFISIVCVLLLVLALAGCATGNTATTSPSGASGAASPSASAAADDDWAYIKQKGELVIGITETAPMNFYDKDGKTLIGFDTEFAEAACAKLGVKPKFEIINWDSKELELKSKNIDCIWNGLTVMEDRKENMAFTSNYLTNRQVVVVKASNADKYKDAASLKGAAIVAEKGSAGEEAISVNLADTTYTPVDSQANALLEVKAGTSDAAVLDYTMASYLTGPGTDYSDLQIVTGINLGDSEFYAIGFRLNSTAVAQFNDVIAEFQKDGTFKTVADKYSLADLLVTA
ncbi:polar amino acid transport system substrate-binding protein [Sporobacter termitidis DSM 10068]|uniref:Polar amino acid transport system substrate-binding protein n=1 Tax=Sporobacter termitidis DSM 10068 TaxID=1123282 RepID=A0A1M5WUX9_9FIRM|nr:transporter substrate-binding domain-containing protein [Sporobacter termitidis]SHH91415.1 polar amino acid transport system substrate-binding protein [Sporobacter termitidis DSM 10068]